MEKETMKSLMLISVAVAVGLAFYASNLMQQIKIMEIKIQENNNTQIQE